MDMKTSATKVLDTLHKAGFEAFLVGGCVRDLIMGRTPHDYDITTNATPEQMITLFDKTIPVGAKFGVVVVVVDGHQIEIATFRSDGDYSDGRRPDSVSYSQTAQEDIERRDFTMNGLLISDLEKAIDTDFITGVTDFVSGIADIEEKLIRCIGEPTKRFTEDGLRMLRAVRFAATLGFDIEENTFKAIVDNAHLITKVSRERIAEELYKIVSAPHPVKGLAPLVASGLFRHIFSDENVLSHNTALMLERFTKFPTTDRIRGLAMLMKDFGYTFMGVLNSLKLSSIVNEIIVNAITLEDEFVFFDSIPFMKRFARKHGVLTHGVDLMEQDVKLDVMTNPSYIQVVIDRFRSFTDEDINPPRLISGQDLIDLFGMKPSPRFGTLITAIETKQLNGELSTKEQAITLLKEMEASHKNFEEALGLETYAY